MALHGEYSKGNGTLTVTEAVQTLVTIPCGDKERVWIDMSLSNNTALDQFIVQVLVHPSGSWRTLYDTATDFTSPKGIIVGCIDSNGDSVNLTAMAANTAATLVLDVRGIYQLRLRIAQATGDASTMTYYWGAN